MGDKGQFSCLSRITGLSVVSQGSHQVHCGNAGVKVDQTSGSGVVQPQGNTAAIIMVFVEEL